MNQQSESIFWIEIEKIRPNPYQPRHEFNDEKIMGLAESIRQYGILQPLVVTRHEEQKEDGGISVVYELIAGERRLRASKVAGLNQVPVLIRKIEDDNQLKLELAIIENLQREDLNPVDRAKAFDKLYGEFGLKHVQIAKKVGKSREYVSNSLRLLGLPEEILNALAERKISEGHTRPILMLSDRPEEQAVLFKEIIIKRLTVRDAEKIARRIAYDKVRKKERAYDPELVEMEENIGEKLHARVHIEKGDIGGKIILDFMSAQEMNRVVELLHEVSTEPLPIEERESMMETMEADDSKTDEPALASAEPDTTNVSSADSIVEQVETEKTKNNDKKKEEDLYDIKNFSV